MGSDPGERGGVPVAERRPGAGVCALRDCARLAAQMDRGHFRNLADKRLYRPALTRCWSQTQYVEFTQRQDPETLLKRMVHAFGYFEG
jgi:transposase